MAACAAAEQDGRSFTEDEKEYREDENNGADTTKPDDPFNTLLAEHGATAPLNSSARDRGRRGCGGNRLWGEGVHLAKLRKWRWATASVQPAAAERGQLFLWEWN